MKELSYPGLLAIQAAASLILVISGLPQPQYPLTEYASTYIT